MSDTVVGSQALADLVEAALDLAEQWRLRAAHGETRAERTTGRQLAALLRDEEGLALAVRFVDEVARPEDVRAAARALATLHSDPAFLGTSDRLLLAAGRRLAPLLPRIVVPAAKWRLRQLVGHLVVDADPRALGRHLERHRDSRLNINLLGEAVLGEQEAAARARRVEALLERDDVDYVSIKVSSVVSQISTWDTAGTVARVAARLRPLLQRAAGRTPHAFVNLDMEEYRDLDLTLEVFEALLSEPELRHLEAGVVLQAYLPDSGAALERLISFAGRRAAAGGAGIKVRLVKGANLSMERVQAEVKGWRPAPYDTKEEVDANYLRLVERALRGDTALRVGVASHNLHDLAMAHLLARHRGVTDRMDVEMLQGMAPALARTAAEDVGSLVLYTPVVAKRDFDVAVAYLVRRLEENAQPQNFLHAWFSADAGKALERQRQAFRRAVAAVDETRSERRRQPGRPQITARFANTPDSDPALHETREWAKAAIAEPSSPAATALAQREEVDRVVDRGRRAGEVWAAQDPGRRANILLEVARVLDAQRGDLLRVMAHEAGKTVDQADPEISEAVDFARYYADRCRELAPGSPLTDGSSPVPRRLTLVTPPWNFPVAIPAGGVLAALAAGSAVVIKPAPQVVRCSEVAMQALWAAGVPKDLLQLVRTDEGDVGRHLVSHPGVDQVVLTGAIETARLFSSWRAGRENGPLVSAETSGKNALVVTPAADLDLAVADLVASAFGHAGQKCSAASLGILVGSVARSERFRRQIVDAVSSLRVGWPDDLGTTMGPLIEPPSDKLRRALTTLDAGESWLVEPRQLDADGRLWSPGVKEGVRPGSFFHLTEVFGPVLGLMAATDLDEALEWQNAPEFGLTGGIHSLDEDEIRRWVEHVQVGNAYVNRVTTGAVVRRQPFGGWKASSVGSGAKAGGPNYVATLTGWTDTDLPRQQAQPSPEVSQLLELLAALAGSPTEVEWLRTACRSDAHHWLHEFSLPRDETGLVSELNLFTYRPLPELVIVAGAGPAVELARVILAARAAGVSPRITLLPAAEQSVRECCDRCPGGRLLWESLEPLLVDPAQAFRALRVRVVGDVGALLDELVTAGVDVHGTPVVANGRLEMLHVLREQAVSRTLHRYGHVLAGRDPR